MLFFISLILIFCNIFLLNKAIHKKVKKGILKVYTHLLIFVLISSLAFTLKLVLVKLNITNLFILEPIIYISRYLVPSSLLIITLLFTVRRKINYKKLFLLHIPSILIILFIALNPIHHTFIKSYSCFESDIVFGNAYLIFNLYTFILYSSIISLIIAYSLKYIGAIPKECIIFSCTTFIFMVLDSLMIYIISSLKYNITPVLLSIYTLHLFDVIIKHEHVTYLAFNLQFIIDKLNSPICLIDKLGNILASNEAFDNILTNILYKGKKPSNNFYEITKEISSPHYNILKTLIQKSIAKKKPISKEFSFTYKKQTYDYIINISAVTRKSSKSLFRKFVRTSHASTLLMFNSLNSIKDEKSKMDTSSNVIEMQYKYATVGELAAGVAHDINTPITAIKTAISILRTYDLKEEEKLALNQMEKSAERITDVSTSIRNQFRNMGNSKKEQFSFNLLLSNIVNITKANLKENNIKLYLDVDPDIMLYGVPAKLTQVILNILTNSIDAYKNIQSISETIIILKAYKGKKNLVITIEDYAGGIPKELKPYIFKNILTTKGVKGFGLGLYIANTIITEDFNGKVTYTSKNNSTSIKISIPLLTDKFILHEV